MFYLLEPEVAGGLGRNTELDRSQHPPVVTRLHYEFDGWLGDALLESFPCYIVTELLREQIESAGATGCTFEDAEITTSEQFHELYPERVLPSFCWLKISGTAGVDDFGMSPDHRLVVSDRVFQGMKATSQLEHCEAESLQQ